MRFVNDKNMAKAIAEKLKAKETVAKAMETETKEKRPDAAGQEKGEKQDGSH